PADSEVLELRPARRLAVSLLRLILARLGHRRSILRAPGAGRKRIGVTLRPQMRDAWLELDVTLKQRIRTVLEDPERLVTEAELRKLSEEGRGLTLILRAELQRLEQRLG